jgi:hypothetical protein
MEATYIGFNMWAKAVEKVGSTNVDKVIAALPGTEVPKLKQFLGDRDSLVNDTTALGGANGDAAAGKSQAYRIRVTLRFADGRETTSEVAIGLRGTDDPYRTLSWQNDVPPIQRARAEF